MFRIAIIALIIYLAWTLLRRLFSSSNRPKTSLNKSGAPAEMVACARCGTFIVKNEAIIHRGKEFCSEQCIKTT